MTQHEGKGSVNPAAKPTTSTSVAGTFLKTTPGASMFAGSIHKDHDGYISYRVYGDFDPGWKDILGREGLARTILSKNVWEAEEFLTRPKKEGHLSVRTFAECLRGLLLADLKSLYYSSVKVLSLDSDEGVFMIDSPDSHFIVHTPNKTRKKDWVDFDQICSFRFPSLSRIRIACKLFWFFEEGSADGFSHVRGAITGATHDECRTMFSGYGHPLVFVVKGFRHIDRTYNSVDLLECIQNLQDIEDKLQHSERHSLGDLSIDLNAPNTKISKLRTCVQFIKASMDSILAMIDVYGHDKHRPILSSILKKWQELELDIISLQKVSEQRLLDVESVQQRINISLSVLSNLLAQKENDWNHNMARSQKTIAMLTMFFLPATFFAILFTLPLFNWDPYKGPVLTEKLWIYWAFTVPLTVLLFLCYFLFGHVKHLLHSLRQKVLIDHRFPFCHLKKKGREEDLETGLRAVDSNVDENDNENRNGKGKAKTG